MNDVIDFRTRGNGTVHSIDLSKVNIKAKRTKMLCIDIKFIMKGKVLD